MPSIRTWWNKEAGGGEVLRIALPLILSNSFWTLQVTIDRVFLSRYDPLAVGASMAGALLFWTPLLFLQQTAAYATTFVAQYHGARRPERIGPAVWQALHFSMAAGMAFLLLIPMSGTLVQLGDHPGDVQALERTYFNCLCFSALPTLLTASACSFFAGRGDSWTVLLINCTGFLVNAGLDYPMIFGWGPVPAMGIAGAGWATVGGCWASAFLGLMLAFRPRHQQEFGTVSGWRLDPDLFRRLMRFGLPNGVQWALEAMAFTCFVLIVGRLGEAELAATSIAFTINMVAFMPAYGLAQAVSILVGQRLGQDRSDLAEQSTWSGFAMAWLYMTIVAALYVLIPDAFAWWFANHDRPELWESVLGIIRILLVFVAVYSIFDSANLIFAFALKGAGDTRFVTLVSLVLAWPIMVAPTWAAWHYGWGLYWAWAFASAYVVAVAVIFLWRFWRGAWKSMRVIEAAQSEEAVAEEDLSLATDA